MFDCFFWRDPYIFSFFSTVEVFSQTLGTTLSHTFPFGQTPADISLSEHSPISPSQFAFLPAERYSPWATCSSVLFVHYCTFFPALFRCETIHTYNTRRVQSLAVGATVYREILVNDSDPGAAGDVTISCAGSTEVCQYHCVSSPTST